MNTNDLNKITDIRVEVNANVEKMIEQARVERFDKALYHLDEATRKKALDQAKFNRQFNSIGQFWPNVQ